MVAFAQLVEAVPSLGLLVLVGVSTLLLDPVLIAMLVDEADHQFRRRSSSAWAKYAEAFQSIFPRTVDAL